MHARRSFNDFHSTVGFLSMIIRAMQSDAAGTVMATLSLEIQLRDLHNYDNDMLTNMRTWINLFPFLPNATTEAPRCLEQGNGKQGPCATGQS
jgi:hypothetical protein